MIQLKTDSPYSHFEINSRLARRWNIVLRRKCHTWVKSKFFYWWVLLVVLLNTLVIATEHHNQTEGLTSFQGLFHKAIHS